MGGDAAATLVALKAAPVGIRSITDNCAETYQEKLSEARQKKVESGKRIYMFCSTKPNNVICFSQTHHGYKKLVNIA